ncbi:MAG: GGDEF domain-containing protein [Acholeplasmataceae bacterium]|nr:GGDEF domain-containing protein [Acholeplasmataceae bacterium]
MPNQTKILNKDFLIRLDLEDVIQFITPTNSTFSNYVNHSIIDILSESDVQKFELFKKEINEKNVVLNYEIVLKDNIRCYFNGYADQTIKFIIVLFESLSDQGAFKKIMKLNSQQVNDIRSLHQNLQSHDENAYEEISKLNSELLNSRRIIEKQNAELSKYNVLLKKMSIEDSLTGCYNRRHFYDYMREKILSSQKDVEMNLVMIDFNHFKQINDQFGHDAGDRLLINFVKISRDFLEDKGEVFRLGGDEFLLLTNHQKNEDVKQLMIKINQEFFKHSMISDLAYGIVNFKVTDINNEFDLTSLIQKSDKLMYENKNHNLVTKMI